MIVSHIEILELFEEASRLGRQKRRFGFTLWRPTKLHPTDDASLLCGAATQRRVPQSIGDRKRSLALYKKKLRARIDAEIRVRRDRQKNDPRYAVWRRS